MQCAVIRGPGDSSCSVALSAVAKFALSEGKLRGAGENERAKVSACECARASVAQETESSDFEWPRERATESAYRVL